MGKTAIVGMVLLAGCIDARRGALPEAADAGGPGSDSGASMCTFGEDCQPGDWCLYSWWDEPGKRTVPIAHQCYLACTIGVDSECATGCCAKIGDAVGSPVPPNTPTTKFGACADPAICAAYR